MRRAPAIRCAAALPVNLAPVASAVSTSGSYTNKPGYVGQLSDLLTLAVSRLTHGAAGPFNINLPLSGQAGVECRNSSIYTVVFTFANPLTSTPGVTATATGMVQPGPSSGNIDPSDSHNYIANLTSLPNAQYITVTLSNVNDSDGNFSNSFRQSWVCSSATRMATEV